MGLNDFQVVSKLGEGSYSSVWKVKRISDGQEYAMKKVKLTSLSDKEKQNSVNEVRILASIRDPSIVSYKEAFLEENSTVLCIIMEYAAGGDLYNKICEHQKAQTFFSEEELWNFAYQMITGLKTLHEMRILHRDLKSANIFLSKDGTEAKLGDLNVSKVLKTNLVYTQTGTPYYASPEIWRDQPYDMKSDIWSLGCVIYEMAALKPPFRAKNMEGLFKKVQKGVFERIPSQYSNDLFTLISLCLKVSPVMRPTCDQLLKHPIVQKNCKSLSRSRDLTSSSHNLLLSTIRFPKNMRALAQVLPKPNYGGEKYEIEEFDLKKLPKISGTDSSMFLSKGYRAISRNSATEDDRMSMKHDMSGESKNSNIVKLDPKPRRRKGEKDKDSHCNSKVSLESHDHTSIRMSRASEANTPKDSILLSEQVSSLKPAPYKPSYSRKVSKDPQARLDLQRMERVESYERKLRRLSNYTTEARSKSIVTALQSEKSGYHLLTEASALLAVEKEKMLDGRDTTPNKIILKQNDVVASYRNRSQVLDEKYSEKRLLDRVAEENSSSHVKSRPVLGRNHVPKRLYNNKSSLDAVIRKSRESPYARHHLDILSHQSYVDDEKLKKVLLRKIENSHSHKNIENIVQHKESVENYIKKRQHHRDEL